MVENNNFKVLNQLEYCIFDIAKKTDLNQKYEWLYYNKKNSRSGDLFRRCSVITSLLTS